jgi:hypothetical protein
VLSLIPPMTQLNTPYPSTAYLTGFLRSRGVDAVQDDLALKLVLELFSPAGLDALRDAPRAAGQEALAHAATFDAEFDRYRATVGPAIAFLQGRDPTLAHRIASRAFLPEGPRFASLDVYYDPTAATRWPGPSAPWACRTGPPPGHAVPQRPGRRAARGRGPALRVRALRRIAGHGPAQLRAAGRPWPRRPRWWTRPCAPDPGHPRPPPAPGGAAVGALPGSVYAAFRIAQTIKAHDPSIVTVLGGGFVNTELRELTEPRVFDYFDYVTLDDGERPLLALLEHLAGKRGVAPGAHLRARRRPVRYINLAEPDIPFAEVGTPTWDGLPLDRYLSILDMLNPMHRLWSDGRWNKLTVAHGCYWKKCSFCDVSLDYIGRYDTASAELLVDRIEAIVAETGQTGFHFVDEAAPPKMLKALADELPAARTSAGGATSASRRPSPPSCASSSPTAAASPSPAAWRWPPTACSS